MLANRKCEGLLAELVQGVVVEGLEADEPCCSVDMKPTRTTRQRRQRRAPDSLPSRIGVSKITMHGDPDPDRICTSIIERQNLTVRIQMRRFTRVRNAFSKKWGNLRATLALHFAHYNLCRMHSSIRMTPAMKAGVTTSIWKVADLLAA